VRTGEPKDGQGRLARKRNGGGALRHEARVSRNKTGRQREAVESKEQLGAVPRQQRQSRQFVSPEARNWSDATDLKLRLQNKYIPRHTATCLLRLEPKNVAVPRALQSG